MLKMQEKIIKLLEKHEAYKSKDGKLLKNKVTEDAIRLDENLIKLLLSDDSIKEHFFVSVNKVLVFDKDKFIRFINNKEFLPDSFTSFKNRIGLMSNGEYIKEKDDVSLVWAYKDCVLEGGQDKENQERDEVFYNEILAPDQIDRLLEPKVIANFKRIDSKGQHNLDFFKEDDNLVIRGNNLLALYSIRKKFRGRIKLIYIDPPYNTGSDSFRYNDKFNHSTWLVFMKNRLEMARELLRDDGIICVQCDDNEHSYLKVLMDEIFGKEHFQTNFYIQVRYPEKQLASAMRFHKLIENILIYSKSDNPVFYQEQQEYDVSRYLFKIKEKRPFKTLQLGNYKVDVFKKGDYEIIQGEKPNTNLLKEIWASGKILDSSSSGRFFRDYLTGRYKVDGLGVLYKVYGIGEGKSENRYFTGPQKEGATRGKYYQEIPSHRLLDENKYDSKVISNFYDLASNFGNCRHEGGVELRSGKKPEVLIKKILDISTQKGDWVLDFFAGTGTTCAVSHKIGRKYIGIEQLNYEKNNMENRLKNVIKGDQTGISKEAGWEGGGSFVYMELKEWNEAYIGEIKKAETGKELLKIYEKMKKEAFFRYEIDLSKFDEKDFEKLALKDQKQILMECLDKNHLYVNYSDIGDSTYAISAEDKKLNKEFYKTGL